MVRVAFSDFYGGYEGDLTTNPVTSYFANSPDHQVVTLRDEPDLIVCSTWGKNHTKYSDTHKIMWSGENLVSGQPFNKAPYTHWDDVEWALATNHTNVIVGMPLNVKHYYIPYGGVHYDMDKIRSLRDKFYNKPKTKFCCFVSRAQGQAEGYALRYGFFRHVNSTYQRVDSGGPAENNIGFCVPRGDAYFDWVSDYKFMICFENSKGAGYLTEKIFTPYAAGTIPIYWGDEGNFDLIRKEACLNYTNTEETLREIIRLNDNPDLYEKKRQQSLFYPDGKSQLLERATLVKAYDEIIAEIKS